MITTKRSFLRPCLGAFALATLATATAGAVGCSSGKSEQTGVTSDSTGEALSPTDKLTHARVMPKMNKHASAKKLAQIKNTAAAGNLTYRGGPLLQHVKIYTVFWGSGVASQTELGQYYTAVTNSSYFDWLSEYDANGMSIGRGTFAGAYTIANPPGGSSIQDSDIANGIDAEITAGRIPKNDPNSLYMVYFPPGVSISMGGSQSCVQFCAYHSTLSRSDGTNLYYGVIPDLGGACAGGCGAGTLLQSTTEVSSHEMIEAVTDPAVGINVLGWYDDAQGEIGDICNGQAGDVSGYQVQLEWSNKNGACIASDPNVPPPSDDAGAPPPPPVDAGGPPPSDDAGAPPPPSGDAGAPPPPSDDAGAPPPPPPPSGSCSVSEQEPNDIPDWADPLDTCLSGALDPAGDIDMSAFSLDDGVPYDITLVADGDAHAKLYKSVNGSWVRVASTSPTEVAHTSNGAGDYLVVVSSPTDSVQSYTLTRN